MNFKKLLCLILCLCFVFGTVSRTGVINASAESQGEYEDRISAIDDEIASYESKLSALAADAEKQKEYLETLEAQIESVEEKANELQTQISEINGDISDLTVQYNQLKNEIIEKNNNIKKANLLIVRNQNLINENKDLLSAKLRSAYMNGNDSTLKILMGADSLASFLTRLEMMKRTTESDKKTIELFRTRVLQLNQAKVQLEEDKKIIVQKQEKVVETRTKYVQQKNALVASQTEYNSTIAELETKYADIETYVASLDQNSAVYQNYISNLEQQKADANAQLEEFLSNYYATQTTLPVENENDSEYDEPDYDNSGSSSGDAYYESTDDWAWPVGGISYYISAYFQDPSYAASIGMEHYAIDITGGGFYGTPIYAARAGTVIVSDYMESGYGYYIVIDHGDGYTTLYGHNSQLVVSVGASVSKGQLIAYAGSTGFSTGAHLHFEVRYNGTAVDPANFYPGYV